MYKEDAPTQYGLSRLDDAARAAERLAAERDKDRNKDKDEDEGKKAGTRAAQVDWLGFGRCGAVHTARGVVD